MSVPHARRLVRLLPHLLTSPSRCLIWLRFIKAAANALRWRLPEPDAVAVYAYWSTAAAAAAFTYTLTHTHTHTHAHSHAYVCVEAASLSYSSTSHLGRNRLGTSSTSTSNNNNHLDQLLARARAQSRLVLGPTKKKRKKAEMSWKQMYSGLGAPSACCLLPPGFVAANRLQMEQSRADAADAVPDHAHHAAGHKTKMAFITTRLQRAQYGRLWLGQNGAWLAKAWLGSAIG